MFDIFVCVFLILFRVLRKTLHKHVEFGREKCLCDEYYTPDVDYQTNK